MVINSNLISLLKEVEIEVKLPIAVGVSGGVDSVTLLHLLTHIFPPGEIYAININHRLRLEAEQEAIFVQDLALNWGAKPVLLTVEGNVSGQARARRARYQLLLDFCQQHHILHLFLAHHLNDQVETLLLNLERGSGLNGVCGMKKISYRGGVKILRPLLQVPKEDIVAWAKEHQLKWHEDASNKSIKYRRNLYRNLLCNLPPASFHRYGKACNHLQSAREALEFYAARAKLECVQTHIHGYFVIDRPKFVELPREIQVRVLASLFRAMGQANISIGVEALLQKIAREPSFACTLKGTIIKSSTTKEILVLKEWKNLPDQEIKKGSWDSRFQVQLIGYEGAALLTKVGRKFNIKGIRKEAAASMPVAILEDGRVILPSFTQSAEPEIQLVLCCYM